MSANNKRLKSGCIATLALGLVSVIFGMVSAATGGIVAHAAATMAMGAISLGFGIWAARAANVPSNARTIVVGAIGVLVAYVVGNVIVLLTSPEGGVDIATIVRNLPIVSLLLTAFYAIRVRREAEDR